MQEQYSFVNDRRQCTWIFKMKFLPDGKVSSAWMRMPWRAVNRSPIPLSGCCHSLCRQSFSMVIILSLRFCRAMASNVVEQTKTFWLICLRSLSERGSIKSYNSPAAQNYGPSTCCVLKLYMLCSILEIYEADHIAWFSTDRNVHIYHRL